jgi:hypothetical protein
MQDLGRNLPCDDTTEYGRHRSGTLAGPQGRGEQREPPHVTERMFGQR